MDTIIPTTPNSPIIGSIVLETRRKANLFVPPDEFALSFDEFAFTFGVQYRASERLSLGAVYRSRTDMEWDGHVTLTLGGASQTVGFDLDMDMPAHLQAGLAYDVIPGRLAWTFIGGLQAMLYEDRTIKAGESQNLGGVSLPNLLDADTLSFTANRGEFSFGGVIWAMSISMQYNF